MKKDIDKYLELEDTYRKEQIDAFNWKDIGKAPLSTGDSYFFDHWDIPLIKQYESKELMLKTQIKTADLTRYSCIGRIPGLRVMLMNFIPTMFGLECDFINGHVNTWVQPVNTDLKDLVSNGMPELSAGIFPKVLEYYEYFKENMPDHYNFDFGAILCPFGTASDILGEKIYLELIDRPHLLKEFLDIVLNLTFETYDWLFSIGEKNNFNEYLTTGQYYNGIRVDSDPVVNLSMDMVREFETPYLKKISEHYKAKVFYHYCDRPNATKIDYNNKLIDTVSESGIICGINQMDFGYWYYIDSYNELKRKKVSINSFKPLDSKNTTQAGSFQYETVNMTDAELENWLYDMHEETYGKSGIHIVLRNVNGIELARKVKTIWDSF